MIKNNLKIGIIGLGYVGLPLAVEFAKYFQTIGFDISIDRINEITRGYDSTLEITSEEIKSVQSNNTNSGLIVTDKFSDLKSSNFIIVTVPTPINDNNNPDLSFLKKASEIVGSVIKKNDIVVYESTVYPGLTEEYCIPIIEEKSKLKYNKDFFAGYSPERINPGDKIRTLTNIKKITSGSNPEVAEFIDQVYATIIKAGTYKASSIKVAEAAKVIENSQRDINIAFVNELAKIFNKMDIDTNEVLDAANTKWNFLDFRPGLVGGHCIGVDPYYLASKSIELGLNPKIILGGREVNDSMSRHIADDIKNLLISKGTKIESCSILILGITFKENCPDIRNSKVFDLIDHLKAFKTKITIYDPYVDVMMIKKNFNLDVETTYPDKNFDLIVLAVPHKKFKNIDFKLIKQDSTLIYDIKNFVGKIADKRL